MSSTAKRTPIVERKPKTIYQLDSPFTTVSWPETSPQIQETILELLCSVLSPIGQHRSNHITPSRGKRSKKRRREEVRQEDRTQETPEIALSPEISSFIMIGLNSITRSLEALSQKSKPIAITTGQEGPQPEPNQIADSVIAESSVSSQGQKISKAPEKNTELDISATQHFAAIFVPRSSQPPILHAHLPQLIATASLAHPSLAPTRLVQLPKGCDARLCDALGLPRVSFIGILEGAPHSKALVELVRENVSEIDVPWLREMREKKYLGVKINAMQTFAPVVEKESRF
ncbi:uncharacterized protein RAG0_08960 [Rhynchosporium agropyri]|uniref:Uncharacterized protein n=1 Tax=Rhynchosporium agropyri TaxID=914238 RepID=A0A1E1KT61_9HELO|nr:uncharacterized protein RAG0_08960 [Rhynchosporium agropyri]